MGEAVVTTAMLATGSKHELRDYQLAAADDLREGLRHGHLRQVLSIPTGGGKTEVAGHLIELARQKGSKCVFAADRIALVRQTSQRFWDMGIMHGVAQGNESFGRYEPVQICSAQTLEKRGWWPDHDLVIIDECHTQRKATTEFILASDKPVIGLSATPFTKGLGAIYSNVVNPVTTDGLTAEGWLAPLKVYAAKEIDMRGVALKGGEWADKDVGERGRRVIGDIVSEYADKTNRLFGGPVKTLLFGPDVDFCEEICAAFQKAGFDFRTSSYRDSPAKSNAMIEGFRRGEYLGLASVDKFGKGFDVPDVLCGILARPFRKSLAGHIQQVGRLLRASPGKEFALVLDHSGNFHGFLDETVDFFANGCDRLDDGRRQDVVRREGRERRDAICGCGAVLIPGKRDCSVCGKQMPLPRSDTAVVPGYMEEIDLTGRGSRRWSEDRRWTWRQMCSIALDRKRGDEKAAARFARMQYHDLYDEWPPQGWGMEPAGGEPDRRVERKVNSLLNAWRRKQRRTA